MKHGTSDETDVGYGMVLGVIPVDTVGGIALLALADAAALVLPDGNPLRVAAALPLLFFLPGYAILSTLFPRRGPDTGTPVARRLGGSLGLRARLDWAERLALSVAVSLALLPVVGVLLSVGGFGLAAPPVLATLSLLIVVGLVGGTVRRGGLPAEDRYRLPLDRVGAWTRAEVAERSALDAGLNAFLAVVVIASLAGIGYAVVAPPEPATGSTASILAPDGNGSFHADDYPETIPADGATLAVAVDNGHRTATSYTVVAELQRVQRSDGGVEVLERRTVGTWQPTVEAGEEWRREHVVEPELRGTGLRLTYYVYEGDAPERPTVASADQSVYIRVDTAAGS